MPNDHATLNENEGDGEFADASGMSVDRVAVRLPPFWPEDPEVWFVQAEAQFQISRVKEDTTKFYHVIAQLDQRYIREIKDIVRNPPTTGKYEKLKQELTKRLSISREHQITQLLSHEELGDRKPSQFLRHLKTLAADGVTEQFLRSLWSNRLPPHVQAIIVSQTGPLEEIAELADKICDITPSPAQVASTSVSNNFDELLKRMDNLIATRVQTELQQQISQLNLTPRGRRTARSNSQSRSRSRSRNPGVCWYHNVFGNKAKKCTSPCNFKSGKVNGRS